MIKHQYVLKVFQATYYEEEPSLIVRIGGVDSEWGENTSLTLEEAQQLKWFIEDFEEDWNRNQYKKEKNAQSSSQETR